MRVPQIKTRPCADLVGLDPVRYRAQPLWAAAGPRLDALSEVNAAAWTPYALPRVRPPFCGDAPTGRGGALDGFTQDEGCEKAVPPGCRYDQPHADAW